MVGGSEADLDDVVGGYGVKRANGLGKRVSDVAVSIEKLCQLGNIEVLLGLISICAYPGLHLAALSQFQQGQKNGCKKINVVIQSGTESLTWLAGMTADYCDCGRGVEIWACVKRRGCNLWLLRQG